mgnify:CR=1 FL=1
MAEELTNTTGQGESSAPVVAEPKVATLQEKLDAYYAMTGLKLDTNCHMDMEYLSLWYETKYLTKVVYRWAMKPGARIVHYVDGIVYKFGKYDGRDSRTTYEGEPGICRLFCRN